jgi:hypothetical protein
MRPLVLACLLIGGCASAESDCRTSDWYALGERDATLGQRPLIAGWAIGNSKTSFRQPN